MPGEEWAGAVLASGELSATSIKEANSSGVRSFGAWTVIGDDSGSR
jgi:hypothetical protein